MQGQVAKSKQSTKNRVNVFLKKKQKTDNLSISLKFIQPPIFLIVNIHWDFLSFFFFFVADERKSPTFIKIVVFLTICVFIT